MNIYFRCLESRIDKNNTLYGKFNLTSIPSGQGNTFANALRRSLFSDLSGLAITHFCITSSPGLGYEFATIPGLAESLLDFSLNLKKVVLTGRLTGTLSTCYKMDKSVLPSSPKSAPFFDSPVSSLPQRGIPKSIRRKASSKPSAYGLSSLCDPCINTQPPYALRTLSSLRVPLRTPMPMPSALSVQGAEGTGKGRHWETEGKSYVPFPLRTPLLLTPSGYAPKGHRGDRRRRKGYRCMEREAKKGMSIGVIAGGESKGDLPSISQCLVLPLTSSDYGKKVKGQKNSEAKTLPSVFKGERVSMHASHLGFPKSKGMAVAMHRYPVPLRPYLVPFRGKGAKGNRRSVAFAFASGMRSKDHPFTPYPFGVRTEGAKGYGVSMHGTYLRFRSEEGVSNAKEYAEQRNENTKQLRSKHGSLCKAQERKGMESESKKGSLSLKENKKYNVQNFPPLASIGFLKAKGPAILRARDLILPPGIRCVHPDQYLGTLAADSALSIKFLIAAGKGYIVQDETFYKSLSRAKLLLSSRDSKNPISSTSSSIHPITQRIKISGMLSKETQKVKISSYRRRVISMVSPKKDLSSFRCEETRSEKTSKVGTILSLLRNQRLVPLRRRFMTYTHGVSSLCVPLRIPPSTVLPSLRSVIPLLSPPESEAKITPMLMPSTQCLAPSAQYSMPSASCLVPSASSKQRGKEAKRQRGKEAKGQRGKGITERSDGNTRQGSNGHGYRCMEYPYAPSVHGIKKRNLPSVKYLLSDAKMNECLGKIITRYAQPKITSLTRKVIKCVLPDSEARKPNIRGKNACKKTSFQRSINQEQLYPLLNDNEKLSRKQLIWSAEDKSHPVLPLDATFTPISKVNFQIDVDRNTEKSEETIILEVWTDGSITPKRAIQESCLALAQDFYSLFSSVNGFSNLRLWWKRESLQFHSTHLF